MTTPDDFAERWQKMTVKELAAHYEMSSRTIVRMCSALGLKRGTAKVHTGTRPMPDGFARNAHLTENALRVRYGCGFAAVRRWRKELGIDMRTQRVVAPSTHKPITQDPSVVMAAKFLQKGRPVHRCDADGKFGGTTHWRCGRQVLTDAALVAKAVESGWDAEEWRRVPAAAGTTIAQVTA